MSDPLAPFRKRPAATAMVMDSASAEDSDNYVAFDAKDRVERLLIHRKSDPSRSPSYDALMDIIFHPLGDDFVLLWDFVIVEVRGKNLLEVVHAIQNGTCKFIQEFDRSRWDAPKDTSAPLIDSIVTHEPRSAPSSKK